MLHLKNSAMHILILKCICNKTYAQHMMVIICQSDVNPLFEEYIYFFFIVQKIVIVWLRNEGGRFVVYLFKKKRKNLPNNKATGA